MTPDQKQLLAVDHVSFSYVVHRRPVPALDDVTLSLAEGEVLCLKGESGSGKSTLVALAAGLEVASQGVISVRGQSLSSLKEQQRDAFRLHNIGVVFQDHNLIPKFSALENVLLVLRCQGNDDPEVARSLLRDVGIDDLRDRRASDMSGGQRQRIGIARAMAGNRRLLLCDEPTGALDEGNAQHVYDLLRGVADSHGVGVVIASHDPRASDLSDRTIELSNGKIVESR